MKYEIALVRAQWFVAAFRDACERIEIVGSVRRGKPDVHDIELLIIPKNEKPVPVFGRPSSIHETKLDKIIADLMYGEILRMAFDSKNGPKYKKLAIVGTGEVNEFCLNLFIVTPPAQWGVQCVIRTGPNSNENNFSQWMVTKKMFGGALPDSCRVKDGAVWDEGDGSKYNLPEEKDFFELCGLPWMEPGQRVARWKK